MHRFSLNELRRKRRAVRNLLGLYLEDYFQSTARILVQSGLHEDQWALDNQAIFIHVPKNAGSSVQTALGNKRDADHHMPAEAYRRANPALFARTYKFAFSRNPWDRLVSAFHFMQKGDHPFHQLVRATDLRGAPDFDSFLKRLRNPLYRHQVVSRLHFMPQTYFLCDRSGQIIVDAIGRFEDLPHSFAQLTAPLAGNYTLPQRNVGKHQHYTTYYQHDWQIELVGKMYRADCEILGYQYEVR